MLGCETCIMCKRKVTLHSLYNRNESGPNIDPWEMPQVRFPGSENCLTILTLQVLPDKYDSHHEFTFHQNPMHPIFNTYFTIYCVPCTSHIQNLCLFCQSVMLNKTSYKIFTNHWLILIFLPLLRKFSVWLWINSSVTFDTRGKSENKQ